MRKIDSPDGLFHEGNPASGQKGTKVTAAWLNDVQADLLALDVIQIRVSKYDTLNAAIVAIGNAKASIIIDESAILSAACQIPSNVNIIIPRMGSINLSGYDLDMNNRPPQASLDQCFTGAGSVLNLPFAPIEWFGGLGDNVTDSYPAFSAAKAAVGSGTVKFTYRPGMANIYKLTSYPAELNVLNGPLLDVDEKVQITIANGIDASRNNSSLRAVRSIDFGLAPFSHPVVTPDKTNAAIAEFYAALNFAPTATLRPTLDFLKAILSGTVKVVIIGDSISAGADQWFANTYAQNLTQRLKLEMPQVTWNVVNLSISGMGAGQLQDGNFMAPGSFSFAANTGGINSQYWPNGSVNNKSWRDHVKDEAPDLIVYAFGMNDGTDVNLFQNNFNSFVETYSQTWNKKPWFSVVSCFLPNDLTTYPAQPHATWQLGAQEIADFVRYKAIQNGYGLIDVNSIFNFLRDGRRQEFAEYRVERDFRYWGDGGRWAQISAPVPTLAGGILTFSATALSVRLINARDIDISADFTQAAPAATVKISYRCRSNNVDLSGFSVQFNGTTLEWYYGDGLAKAVVLAAIPQGTPFNVRVKATGNLHEIWINGVLQISEYYQTSFFAGSVWIGYAAGSGTIANIIMQYTDRSNTTVPIYTREYLYGMSYPSDHYSNLDSIGGNSINHPTAKGMYAYYMPALVKFVNQLKDWFNRPKTLISQYSGAAIGFTGTGGVFSDFAQLAPITIKVAAGQRVEIEFDLGYNNLNAVNYGIIGVSGGISGETFALAPTNNNDYAHRSIFNIVVYPAANTYTITPQWTTDKVSANNSEFKLGGNGGVCKFKVTVQ